jgi:predicted short-subunit dehydrogenase-like oxidoreductase (DUF2520 family)
MAHSSKAKEEVVSNALRIVVLGAGNVGLLLSKRLSAQGCPPMQIFSRSVRQIEVNIPMVHRIEDIMPDADLYLIAVSDDAISAVAHELSKHLNPAALVAHSSGSTPSTVLASFFNHYGVCYPLQTFSAGTTPDFKDIPICIYATLERDLACLNRVACILSDSVHVLDDSQRARLHLAAVFVNNFVNHLYHAGYQLLDDANLPFELLLPLIRETAAKVRAETDPAAFQTGPAKRGDEKTILRHLDALQKYPALSKLYEHLTYSIQSTHLK